jgi:type IV secretory pathway TraG/TraD family ATPase VirD4
MKRLNNERGIALVTALLLTLISLTIVMALFYMLTQGVKTSSSTKHYANALEATYGGVEFFTKDALPQMLTMASSAFNSGSFITLYPTLNMTMPNTSNGCMQAKLTNTSASWVGAGCVATNLTSDISQLKQTADMTFTFPGTVGSSAYTVYSKIIDTAIGNTDTSQYASGGLLIGAGVSRSGSSLGGGNSPATKIPYLFTVEVQGEAALNPQETTRVTLLYAF